MPWTPRRPRGSHGDERGPPPGRLCHDERDHCALVDVRMSCRTTPAKPRSCSRSEPVARATRIPWRNRSRHGGAPTCGSRVRRRVRECRSYRRGPRRGANGSPPARSCVRKARGELDRFLLRDDALRNYTIYGVFGISVFALRDATVDELAPPTSTPKTTTASAGQPSPKPGHASASLPARCSSPGTAPPAPSCASPSTTTGRSTS